MSYKQRKYSNLKVSQATPDYYWAPRGVWNLRSQKGSYFKEIMKDEIMDETKNE